MQRRERGRDRSGKIVRCRVEMVVVVSFKNLMGLPVRPSKRREEGTGRLKMAMHKLVNGPMALIGIR